MLDISYWQEFVETSKKVLLLQGPIGPYFSTLRDSLEKQNKTVYKLNFNGGDCYYHHFEDLTYRYTDTLENFYVFLKDFIKTHNIDSIVCFGHKREYHKIAKKLCMDLDHTVSFWAFEEGYLRPYYITFEKWGVNNSSVLPKTAEYYLKIKEKIPKVSEPQQLRSSFFYRAWVATNYYMHMYLCKDLFPNYKHHRDERIWRYIGAWWLSGWRKYAYKFQEYFFAKNIESDQFPDFFIVPLQVHNDSQVKDFSKAKNVPAFIKYVIRSFSSYANKDNHIIFKHHPMDRGFNHYGKVIEKIALRYGVEDRVHYVFDVPLPVFLRKAKGVVLINSTSGLSALLHRLPVKVLGKAPYDFEGLTDQKKLNDFWQDPQAPDFNLFQSYRAYLLWKTQLNCNFYMSKKFKKNIQ